MRALSLIVMLCAAAAFGGETELGAVLPDGARKVAEHRFRAPSDFEGTLKFFKNIYSLKDFPRRPIVNQPGIKAIHIANVSGRGSWEGLNIYETADGVRIYVVPAETSGKKKMKK